MGSCELGDWLFGGVSTFPGYQRWKGCEEGSCLRKLESPSGFVKLNSDAAVKIGREFVGVAVVFRDDGGRVLLAAIMLIRGLFSAEVGDILALREKLKLAKQHGFLRCLVKLDAANIVTAINDSRPTGNNIAGFIFDDVKATFEDVHV
ncbi:hypothetical protein Ddye_009777 [Dipteronia dyeriana]|uniref:RNase H type-1 domain-containing protein n=1 Tax=Dipteronia dyeriana TaxID=168575 RepID=A0AAE0CMI9_9ROSI|nr:hypothetical protein Ddye_009777 [Dipteronia dyeriana]